ncbi:hypothetical protein QAD02_016638 [Eretmocerus hayati]|uniref:Uncharacterized protein n=1 Tax=Eretmocerus hayati TaxID=131215 RepID=A0ACC2PCY5_9HYME|nr:hypothetical protein QAD02_016638 [Eretmocerus hayati]
MEDRGGTLVKVHGSQIKLIHNDSDSVAQAARRELSEREDTQDEETDDHPLPRSKRRWQVWSGALRKQAVGPRIEDGPPELASRTWSAIDSTALRCSGSRNLGPPQLAQLLQRPGARELVGCSVRPRTERPLLLGGCTSSGPRMRPDLEAWQRPRRQGGGSGSRPRGQLNRLLPPRLSDRPVYAAS